MQEQENPITKQLAEQLRDVHLPESVSWWPLAFGWWLLLVLIVLSLIGAGIFLFKRWRANRYRKSARAKLATAFALWQEQGDVTDYLNSANDILKRVMLSLDQQSAVSKSGAAWVASLNNSAQTKLSESSQNALGFECYKAKPEVDIATLNADLVSWINTHRLNDKLNRQGVMVEPQTEGRDA